MNEKHLVLHGLAIKKHGTPEAVAELMGLNEDRARQLMDEAVANGRVNEAGGKYMLTPMAQMSLKSAYSKEYADPRGSENFLQAYQNFERINVDLKQIITDWQTLDVGGDKVPNDHSNSEYDEQVIDSLGELHERVEPVLDQLAGGLSRLAIYKDKLLAALEKAEDGDIQWVSDAKIDSYHTVWFELHEDLLRITGNERDE
ncbi:MAG: hypothetical protein CMN28_05140 [Salinisphaeraceae bacterium]|jgi:hypothetical protein|nr:hypothetical protein [Salinisphaeraceae bacterium]